MDNLKVHESLLGATLLNSSRSSERKILAVWVVEDRLTCLCVSKDDGHMIQVSLPDYNWYLKVDK